MKGEYVSRRDFLKGMAVMCASGMAGISGLKPWLDAAEAAHTEVGCLEEPTMKAFVDTIIPGPSSDPQGSAGGNEACAYEVLHDPYYGLKPFIGLISWDLNQTGLRWHGRFFKDLDLSQRTAIMSFKDNAPLMRLFYEQAEVLVKLAFYGAIINDVGTTYISFPGPSNGYRDYSFDEKFSEEATEDGNLP
jgi:hypothetical protein